MHAFVSGARTFLRALEPSDVDRCLEWINDTEITRFLLAGRFPFNRLREEEFLRGLYTSQTELILGICDRSNGEHIGNCGLHKIDMVDRCAELGIFIGDKSRQGRGHGTEAVSLLVGHAFDTLNLNRVELGVFETNPRAVRSYVKAGFKEEGRLRQRRFKRGRYLDEIRMAILREERPK